MAQIDNLRSHFSTLNTAQQKEFIDKLKVKVQASKSPEHTKFLNECVKKYNSALQPQKINSNSLDDLMDIGSNKEVKPNYPVEARWSFTGILLVFVSASSLITGLNWGWGIVYMILLGITGVIGLSMARYSVYVGKCPYCGKALDFPVNEEGANCEACEKRAILINGVISRTE